MAVADPVMAGDTPSLETLPDIVDRQKLLLNWRTRQERAFFERDYATFFKEACPYCAAERANGAVCCE
jgi:hypothetical protein